MKNDDFEKLNDLSSLSDVHIDNEEGNISNVGILACDQNQKYFLFQEIKQIIFLLSFLLLISLFIPSNLQYSEILHQFDSKHYPNYTIFAQIKNLPKYSIHGFFVSLKFFNFKDYVYKPKHDNKLAHFHQNKLEKSFLFQGNLNIQLSDLATSLDNDSPIFNTDIQHIFLISHKWDLFKFRRITKTDEFVIFSDKLPKYDTFILNMTVSARHPRAEEMIITFYYTPNIYEIFDLLIRITLIICILSTRPHFYYFQTILTHIKYFFNSSQQTSNILQPSELSIQHILTFILRFITILYIFIPIISGSISSISFLQIPFFSFIMNINIIIRDLFFSYSLFYIISILRMIEKETDLTSQYLIQGSKENDKIIFDECYDNKLSFLIRPFMVFAPLLLLMIINDSEKNFSPSFIEQNSLISIAPKGFFIFRSLESFDYNHLLLFFVFFYFLVSTVYQLKKFLQKNNLKMKDHMFNYIKNRSDNYLCSIYPFVVLLFIVILKSFVILIWISSKSELNKIRSPKDKKIESLLNSALKNEPTIKIVNFTSKDFENYEECKKESKFMNLFLFSLVNLFSFEEKTAFLPTLSIIFPSLFTIMMSILHTPSKL